MKANIRKELVLLYHVEENTDKGAAVAAVLSRLGVPYHTVTDNQLGESVGYNAGMPGFEAAGTAYAGAVPPDAAMVFKDLAGSRFNQLLSKLKEAAPGDAVLKAVVTDTNKGWPFYKLLEELAKEREAIRRTGKAAMRVTPEKP